MNIGNFNELNNEKNINSNDISSLIQDFIKQLIEKLKPKEENIFQKYPSDADFIATYNPDNDRKIIEEGDICVYEGRYYERASFIDTVNGKQFDLYYAIDDETYNKLLKLGIDKDKIVRVSEDFYMNLMQGDRFIQTKENGLQIYNGEFDIDKVAVRSCPDTDIWYYLKEMDEMLKKEEGEIYTVTGIENGKIKLETEKLIGHTEIFQKMYPEVKVGDILVKRGRKYVKENLNEEQK